jgi:hypothetical protein
MGGSHHERKQSVRSDRTCVFSTNVQEDWTTSGAVIVFIILPDSLRVSIFILIIIMINWRRDVVLNEIIWIDCWKIFICRAQSKDKGLNNLLYHI